MGLTRRYIEDRIEIDPKTKCWNWTGLFNSSDYPVGKEYTMVHREVKVVYDGHTFQEGQVADHVCQNTHCVNPAHIRVTNKAVNAFGGYDRKTGSMAYRRLKVVRLLHDTWVDRWTDRAVVDD